MRSIIDNHKTLSRNIELDVDLSEMSILLKIEHPIGRYIKLYIATLHMIGL
jgi:hypothetical protein